MLSLFLLSKIKRILSKHIVTSVTTCLHKMLQYNNKKCFISSKKYRIMILGGGNMIKTYQLLLEELRSYKNPKTKIQRIADKISWYFVPIIIAVAIITFLVKLILWDWIQDSLIHAITVLVVACPCALWLSVPLVHSLT